MPTRRVIALALACLLMFVSCTTGDGEKDSDADGFSDEAEEEAGTDPNDNRSKPDGDPPSNENGEGEEEPAEEPVDTFVAVESFEENPDDVCFDSTGEIPCTDEFTACEVGMVGDLAAVRCEGVEARDGTTLSLAAQFEGITDGGITVRWGCQAEPETGSAICLADVLDNGESVYGEACEYDGELLDDTLVLVSPPALCGEVPTDLIDAISGDSPELNFQSLLAAAFLNENAEPEYGHNGVVDFIDLAMVREQFFSNN